MDRLTRRQAEVLAAFCATGSLEQAAALLGLSRATVRNHLTGVYDRLGVRNGAPACYLLGRAEGRAEGPRADAVGTPDGAIATGTG